MAGQKEEYAVGRIRSYTFNVLPMGVSVHRNGEDFMTLLNGKDSPKRIQAVACSMSKRHSVFLSSDGVLSAESNSANYDSLYDFMDDSQQRFKSVFAGICCTYAVNLDGKVIVQGEILPTNSLSEWTDVKKIVGHQGRVVGLTEQGNVRINDKNDRIVEVGDAIDVATTFNFTLWLKKDGTVGCQSDHPDDSRGKVSGWRNVTAIGVDNDFAYALTSGGHVLCTEKPPRCLKDMTGVQEWEKVSCLIANTNGLLAVFCDSSARFLNSMGKCGCDYSKICDEISALINAV